MRKNNGSQFNWPRFLLQWGSMAVIVLLLVGWGGNLLSGTQPDWWRWVIVGFAALCVLFANFFCGYICAFGSFGIRSSSFVCVSNASFSNVAVYVV